MRSEFKGFDDDFSGPMKIEPAPQATPKESLPAPEPEPEPQVASQSLFCTQNIEMEVDRSLSQPPQTLTRTSRKRRASPIIEDDFMEQMAPTTTALKRRKLAESIDRRNRGESSPGPTPAPVKEAAAVKSMAKKPKKEKAIDVEEVVRKKREEEEAEKKAMEEATPVKDEGPIEEMRVVHAFEEMAVTRNNPPLRSATRADEGERWDDKWNGRRNFKKFRRRGAESQGRRIEKVIVALEAMPRKDFGIGNTYWDEGDTQRVKKKIKETHEESQRTKGRASVVRASEFKDSDSDFPEPDNTRAAMIVDSDSEEGPIVASRASQRGAANKLVDKTSVAKNMPTTARSSSKRAAAAPPAKAPPAKKSRQTTLVRDSDEESDSDDELKFRMRKRR